MANQKSWGLIKQILSEKKNNYTDESDAKDMLDIILCLTCGGYMKDPYKQPARQLMFQVLEKMTDIPTSLLVTEANRSSPELKLTSFLTGELQGKISRLKISYKPQEHIVSCSCRPFSYNPLYFVQPGFLPCPVELASPQSQLRATFSRYL